MLPYANMRKKYCVFKNLCYNDYAINILEVHPNGIRNF